jgi:hypothetical protein
MAKSLPIVVSPLASVFEKSGIDVVLVSVEAWPDEVVIRLRGGPSELTQMLDAEFHATLAETARLRQTGGGSPPPVQPAERVFDFQVSLSDDFGTNYSPTTSSLGGSGRMFRAEWFFTPGPPEAATSLTVSVGDREPTLTRIELDPDN